MAVKDKRLAALGTSTNALLVDNAIRHAIYLERYKTGEVNRILTFLDEKLLPDVLDQTVSRLRRIQAGKGFDAGPWTTARLTEMTRGVSDMLLVGATEVYQGQKSRLIDLASAEARLQVQALERVTPKAIGVEYTLPSPSLLKSIVTTKPFEGRLLKKWYGDLSKATAQKVSDQINIGVASGETIAQMARRLTGTAEDAFQNGTLPQMRRQAATVARTATSHITTMAREETYEANTDLIAGVRWLSTLDGKTTPICFSLDGRVFAIGEGPRPPVHMNERSTTVPQLKDLADIGIGAGKVDNLPVGTRASFNGQVSAKLTLSDFLRAEAARGNRGMLEDVLGKGRAALFLRDKVPAERFINRNLRPLTLKELIKVEASINADLLSQMPRGLQGEIRTKA